MVLAAVALGAYGFENGPALIVTFAAGSAAMLWSTRLRPVAGLVDLAIALAVPAALCATAWRVGWVDPGRTLCWMAVALAAVAGVLWASGRVASVRPSLALHAGPALRGAAILTWFVDPLALAGAAGSSSYRVAVAALALNAAVLVLLTVTRRRSWSTYRAALAVALGAYVIVFNVGTPRPDTTYVLGLVAVVLALAFSAVAFACRSWATPENGLGELFVRPLFVLALVLTLLGIAPAYDSPWTMVLVALSFLVMVKGLPTKRWLYAMVASLAAALYFGYLIHWPPDRMVTAAVVIAYQLWLVALLTRRAEPALVRLLDLPERGYDLPLFNSAAVAAAVAVALRVNETVGGPLAWSDSAGLALNLAAFALLMLKAYPHAGWVHLAVALASCAAGLAAYPHVTLAISWLPLGMGLAVGWVLLARLLRRYEPQVCRWCRVPDLGYSELVGLWSQGFFAVTTAVTAVLVSAVVVAALAGTAGPPDPSHTGPWLGVSLALGLGGLYTVLSWRAVDRDGVVMGLVATALLAVWWLAAPVSPLVARLGVDPRVYLPVATAASAALTTAVGLGLTRRPGWRGAFWRREPGADPVARLDAFAAQAGVGLAVLAALMTRGEVGPATVAALALATLAPGVAAAARRWVGAGYVSGVVWTSAGVFAALEAVRRAGGASAGDAVVAAAVGALAGLASLWAAAGWLRRGGPPTAPAEAVAVPAGTVPLALEQVALAAALVAAGAVGASALGTGSGPPGRTAELAGVGVMFGLALFLVGLIVRWGAEWLVYASQSALLGGYLYYRWAFPLPATTDAVILTAFGYLDLGLAEVMHRVGLSRFARPTRFFSLALPVLPLALALGEGGSLGEARLFVLFAAATFYGIACYAMSWKPLGYTAAVLYNAFLWLLWGRIGWHLADHSQFFLIPVGLSAVLFAEVNRQSLGRPAVNAIRGVGLAVIYLSLVFPVWQFASLGAWVALLLLSLAGIFAGIGLRVQVFLWLGLAGFVLDVVYQLGRMGLEYPLAKWAIMLVLGILLVLFVALNEKKRIVATLHEYLDRARQWE